MQYSNENKYFESSDLSLITTLASIGYNVEAIDRNNGSRATFLIPRDKFLDEKIQAFWSHSITVDPLIYFNCLKELKTRLYNT